MNKQLMKKALPYIGSVLFMILLSYIYFTPDIFENKVLFQGDMQQGIAIGQEGIAFKEKTGETTRWTNSIFSGMPNFQISPSYDNNTWINQITNAYHLWIKTPASLVFIMMLGFFILLITLMAPGSHRCNCLCFFILFFYNHSSRSYLEIHHFGLYSPNNSRHSIGL